MLLPYVVSKSIGISPFSVYCVKYSSLALVEIIHKSAFLDASLKLDLNYIKHAFYI